MKIVVQDKKNIGTRTHAIRINKISFGNLFLFSRDVEIINDFQPFSKPRRRAVSPAYFNPMASPWENKGRNVGDIERSRNVPLIREDNL